MEARTLTLQRGPLRFTATDVGSGPLILCLHGFPDHRGTWEAQLGPLSDAGYRVVAPQLRGYEPASCPRDGDVSISTLAGDVLAWLDELGAPRAILVGHDWGAAIATAAAVLAPDRISHLITLAVPPLRRMDRALAQHPEALKNLWYMAFFQLPVLPERALAAGDGALLHRLWRDWSPGHPWTEAWLRSVRETFAQPGVARAALGYYRTMGRPLHPRGRESIRLLRSPVHVPTLALTGERDGCISTDLFDAAVDLRDFPRGIQVVRVPDAGHFLHRERPELVNAQILQWLDPQRSPR